MPTNAKEFIEEKTIAAGGRTLEEVRAASKIDIMLPVNTQSDDRLDSYEYPTVNGKTYQIKRGEPVAVPWPVYKVLVESGKYKDSILV
jgi:hypothetical protein